MFLCRRGGVVTMHPTRSEYSKFLFIQLYSMLRKNSEKRFHTAGARIVNSSKLPPDFFRPNQEKGAPFRLHRSQPHQKPPAHARTTSAIDPLLVTFHRSASQNKLENGLRYSCGEERATKKGMLPPVCHPMEKQNAFGRQFREAKLMKIRNKNLKAGGWGSDGDRQMLRL